MLACKNSRKKLKAQVTYEMMQYFSSSIYKNRALYLQISNIAHKVHFIRGKLLFDRTLLASKNSWEYPLFQVWAVDKWSMFTFAVRSLNSDFVFEQLLLLSLLLKSSLSSIKALKLMGRCLSITKLQLVIFIGYESNVVTDFIWKTFSELVFEMGTFVHGSFHLLMLKLLVEKENFLMGLYNFSLCHN